MILNYEELVLTEEELKDIELQELEVDDQKIKYLSKDDFEDYKENQLKQNNNVIVVRNTSFKKFKDDEEPEEFLQIGEYKYKLKDEKSRPTKGYLYVGNNQFVRIEKSFIFIILLFLLLGICLLGSLLTLNFQKPEDPIIPLPDLKFEDEDEWDGEQYQNGQNSVQEQESTTIPGFSKISASPGASLVQLYNPEENTVYFVYTVTNVLEREVVASFTPETQDDEGIKEAQDKAQKYVNENQLQYTNYYDEATGNYMLEVLNDNTYTDHLIDFKVIENEGVYEIHKITSEVIYFTNAIAPNNKKDWDVKESFEPGEYKDVQIRVSTYDLETEAVCYGAICDVEIYVY